MANSYTSLKRVSVVREGSMKGRYHITGTMDARLFVQQYFLQHPSNDQERFIVALLNTKNTVQSVVTVTTGTLDASLVHPREVFKPAIIEGSCNILIAHNHPSGDPTPSRQDREVLKQLEEAGKILGIKVLDHIVFGDGTGETVSLREL